MQKHWYFAREAGLKISGIRVLSLKQKAIFDSSTGSERQSNLNYFVHNTLCAVSCITTITVSRSARIENKWRRPVCKVSYSPFLSFLQTLTTTVVVSCLDYISRIVLILCYLMLMTAKNRRWRKIVLSSTSSDLEKKGLVISVVSFSNFTLIRSLM